MPTVIAFKPSFTGGEISPSMYARTDLQKYNSALKTCRNFIVQPFGGVYNRPGMEYVANTKNNGVVRLVPFQFNVVQSYLLEFGSGYMRIFRDGAPVVYPVGHEHAGEIVEISTPFLADLEKLSFAQSADTIYFAHPSYAPRKLTRTDHHLWTFSTITYGSQLAAPTGLAAGGSPPTTTYSYCVAAMDNDGVGPVAASTVTAGAGQTLSWNAVTGTASGGTVRYKVFRVISGVYATVAVVNSASYLIPSGETPDFDDVAPDVISDPFHSSYPRKVSFFEQRLVFAATNAQPQTIFGSRTGSFENFNKSFPLQSDDAYEFTVASGLVNAIRGMVGLSDLILITAGAVWKAVGEEAITPTNIQLRRQSEYGGADLDPIVIGEGVLYVQGSQAAIRDLMYSLENDTYRGNDLTLLATHLFHTHKIISWTKQRYPFTVVWCVRDDGALLGLTYERDQSVIAWHRHDTDGKFEEACSVLSTDGLDDVYFVVQRTINGSTVRTIEWLTDRLPQNNVELGFFVDCGLSWNNPISITAITKGVDPYLTAAGHGLSAGDLFDIRDVTGMVEIQQGDDDEALPFKRYLVDSVDGNNVYFTYPDGSPVDSTLWTTYTGSGTLRKAVTSVSGLSHLEGKEVSILANGSEEPRQTVVSGAITIESPASIIHVGLPYTCDVQTLELTADSQDGTVQDKKRDVVTVVAYVENTRVIEAGPDEDNLNELPLRLDEAFDIPTELYTGTVDIAVEPGDGESASVLFRCDSPLPVCILAVIPRIIYGRM